MLTLKRLLLLLAITSFAMMTSACIANPTPHPGSGDNTGLNAPSDPTMGGSGASEAPSTAASAQDDGAESGNAVGGSEPNTGSADTSSESDAAPSEDTAAGPDAEDDDAQGDDAQDDDAQGDDAQDDDAQGDDAQGDDAQGDDAQDDDAQGDDAQGDDTADVTWGAVCTVDLDCDAPADLCVLQPGASEGYCSVACPNLGADCTYDDWTCNVVGTCEAPMATWCGPPSEVAEGGGFIVACE